VRSLPVVRASEKEGGLAGYETIVVFGQDAALFVQQRGASATAVKTDRKRLGRIRARAAAESPPNYGCPDNYFCLYNDFDFNAGCLAFCKRVQFGPAYTGNGWQRLGDHSFNDQAASMRNRRDRDSLLAQHWNGSTGTGTQYCADSHSSDASFANNAIGISQASAFANVPDDIHC
jgi:hypothetical protein